MDVDVNLFQPAISLFTSCADMMRALRGSFWEDYLVRIAQGEHAADCERRSGQNCLCLEDSSFFAYCQTIVSVTRQRRHAIVNPSKVLTDTGNYQAVAHRNYDDSDEEYWAYQSDSEAQRETLDYEDINC